MKSIQWSHKRKYNYIEITPTIKCQADTMKINIQNFCSNDLLDIIAIRTVLCNYPEDLCDIITIFKWQFDECEYYYSMNQQIQQEFITHLKRIAITHAFNSDINFINCYHCWLSQELFNQGIILFKFDIVILMTLLFVAIVDIVLVLIEVFI